MHEITFQSALLLINLKGMRIGSIPFGTINLWVTKNIPRGPTFELVIVQAAIHVLEMTFYCIFRQ
jgi:hypothetical protein